jgi:enoyl-CoA hydratase/carnithine racemase
VETLARFRSLSADALRVAKRALRLSRTTPTAAEVEAAEALYMSERLNAPDAIEGLTAFMEKRAPEWNAKR